MIATLLVSLSSIPVLICAFSTNLIRGFSAHLILPSFLPYLQVVSFILVNAESVDFLDSSSTLSIISLALRSVSATAFRLNIATQKVNKSSFKFKSFVTGLFILKPL